ncbi:MAG: prolipoprotein diacylglyceryl transferase [Desulfobulbaceae bacterium]|nr:prolipoprotein diacylglyceryl transferase [Desulfobulbaceae bacterium]
MLPFPQIDPAIISLGPVQIRWYGLMYVLGFMATYWLVQRQIQQRHDTELARHFENLNFTLMLSLILGGRLGYVLFYNFSYYLEHPSEILATWQGGMSFHGAMIGTIVGGIWFCRSRGLSFWRSADIYVVTIPIGLGLGRIGNFINGELFGRETTMPWAMIFPEGGPYPRHPSQIYECLLEGVILFIILWKAKDRPHANGQMLSLFLIIYGLFRILVERFREPDPHIGFIGALTMGQILSVGMVALGLIIFIIRQNGKDSDLI